MAITILICLVIVVCAVILYKMTDKKPRIVPLDHRPDTMAAPTEAQAPPAETENIVAPLWLNTLSVALDHIYSNRSPSAKEQYASAHHEPSETTKVTIGAMVNSFHKISTLHSSLTSLGNPALSMRDVGAAVMRDPILSAQVLKVANSPAFGLAQEVRSIYTAVTILGINSLKSILTFHTMPHALYVTSTQRSMFRQIWEHMNITAIIASFMAKASGGLDSGLLYTAGLMHDIGKLVLIPLIKNEKDEPEQIYPIGLEQEYELLFVTHLQAAQIMGERENHKPLSLWNLILDHHLPAFTPVSQLSSTEEAKRSLTILFLANQLAKLITTTGELDEKRVELLDSFDPSYAEIISKEDVQKILLNRDLMQDILDNAKLTLAMLN
jgi:HD-like signal output (HDOD) protein